MKPTINAIKCNVMFHCWTKEEFHIARKKIKLPVARITCQLQLETNLRVQNAIKLPFSESYSTENYSKSS